MLNMYTIMSVCLSVDILQKQVIEPDTISNWYFKYLSLSNLNIVILFNVLEQYPQSK